MPHSGRNVIDANSNTTFSQQTQYNNYRGSYGTSSPLPYTTTTTSYHHHGYANETSESKKVIADVSEWDDLAMMRGLCLASGTNSNFEKRFRKKRYSYSRIDIHGVKLRWISILNLFVFFV